MDIVFMGNFAKESVGSAIAGNPELRMNWVADESEINAEMLAQMEALVMVGPMYSPTLADKLKTANRLKWIQALSAGYEKFQALGVPSNVTVTNAGEAWAIPVAEHAMALLLSSAKRLQPTFKQQEQAQWNRIQMPAMKSLHGTTVVIVGFGAIGKAFAQRAKAFDMRVIAVNQSGRTTEGADLFIAASDMDSVLAQADVVVLALPSSAATKNMFDEGRLLKCKRGCMIINVARGDVIDQDALEKLLRSGHLAGAGLDVTTPEPLPNDHALWSMLNVIITPHVAGGGQYVHEKLSELVIENIRKFRAGERLQCIVMDGGMD